jgi:type II secretory pathway component GspD/PulD (secretin)
MNLHRPLCGPSDDTPTKPIHVRKATAWALAIGVILLSCSSPLALAQALDTSSPKPVHGQISIARDVNIAPKDEKVSLNLRDTSLRYVLNTLAEQGHFNLILDDSVQGNLTVDIKNISINKALEYIFTVTELSYTKDGNTVIVATKTQADSKNLNARTFKAIPVLYKDASKVAQQLNETIFKIQRPGGSTTAVASSDPDSNSLLIMGTDSDIKLIGDMLHELDVPRNRKVYNIRHNTPTYVASVLAANFFQSGGGSSSGGSSSASGDSAGGSASGGAAASSSAPSGGASGAGASGGSSAGGSASGGGSASSGGSSGGSSSASSSSTSVSTFTAGGATFISEPFASTLTVLATDEQLALIDSLIDQVDIKRPQVEIEVSLVEIQNSELKKFKPIWGQLNLGKETALTLNQLDSLGNTTGNSVLDWTRANIPSVQQKSMLSTLDVSQNHQSLRGKVLANPTIVAMDGQSSTITITDQIPSVTQSITTPTVGPPIITNTITTQDAGITLKILPTISYDGSVVLKLQPDVSQPTRVVTAGNASTTLISKRTLDLSGVRVMDGQTLVIGGLLKETSQLDVNRIPGLDKLPIVSAMFRTINGNNKDKTELVLMVTPHILRENAVPYFNLPNNSTLPSNTNHVESLQPVSLPKFIGLDPALKPKADASQGNDKTTTPITGPKQGTALKPLTTAEEPSAQDIARLSASLQSPKTTSVPNQSRINIESADTVRSPQPEGLRLKPLTPDAALNPEFKSEFKPASSLMFPEPLSEIPKD